jgi:putative endonuclease
MYYVYIIKSIKFKNMYIGQTNNLVKRLAEHNTGKSLYTKKYLPWKLVYFEGYAGQDDAHDREKKLKQFGKVYAQLKRRIKRSLGTEKVRG